MANFNSLKIRSWPAIPAYVTVVFIGLISFLLTLDTPLHTEFFISFNKQFLLLTAESLDKLQLWRLITGHFSHINLNHWAGNTVALIGGYIIWRDKLSSGLLLALLLWLSISLSIALLLLPPRPEWYAGLSGVIMGLYVFCALRFWQRLSSLETLILLVISAKVAAEQLGWHIERDFPVIYAAHLYGAVIGAITALAIRILRPTTKQPL